VDADRQAATTPEYPTTHTPQVAMYPRSEPRDAVAAVVVSARQLQQIAARARIVAAAALRSMEPFHSQRLC
jgi:hypothetical protein